jgi:hypothetical protein
MKTDILDKLLVSAINILVSIAFIFPVFFLDFSSLQIKFLLIGSFLLLNIISLIFYDYVLPGMWLRKTQWADNYQLWQKLVHIIIYTASFSTLLFYIRFPFDIFLINMLVLQLPSVMITGTTFHGLLSGGMVTVKQDRK